jgi:hypothetical protein
MQWRFFANYSLASHSVIPLLADANAQGETPNHLLVGTKYLVPRRRHGAVGEPIVREPTRIVVHPSADIRESTRSPDVAAALQSPRHYAEGAAVAFERPPAPAPSAPSAGPNIMQYTGEAIS